MEYLNWREVISKQAEVFAWLRAAGLDKRHRFQIHHDNIREVLQADAAGTFAEYNAALTVDDRRARLWSMCETLEFVHSLSVLQPLRPPGLLEVVSSALDGPADLYFENESCNAGRNRMYEIVIAADLARAGIPILFGEHPDVTAEFEDRDILIECKRPLGLAGMRENVRRAGRQLCADVSCGEFRNPCTIASICCSRALNPGDRILRCPTEETLRPMLDRWLGTKVERLRSFAQQMKRHGITAAHFYVSSPVWVDSMRKSTIGRAGCMVPLAASNVECQILQRLARELKI